MNKFKKMAGICLAAMIVLCTNVVSADIIEPISKCQENEYLSGKVCKSCPEHAICDGINAKCKEGYQDVAKNIHDAICKKITCPQGKYMVNNVCVDCPEYAFCDGINANCPAGYTKDSKGYITCKSCGTNGWFNRSSRQCVKTCPANATCDGWNVRCNEGFSEAVPNKEGGPIKCVQKPVNCPAVKKVCSKNQYRVKDPCDECVNCPANATCNGTTVQCNEGFSEAVPNKEGRIECMKKPVNCPTVMKRCSKNQYMVQDPCDKCVDCPANATCNGSSVTCKEGYVAKVKGGYFTCVKQSVKPVKKCEKGSHVGYDWIKKNYKNCSKCRTEKIKKNKCSKNKKAHKHYYCTCDC